MPRFILLLALVGLFGTAFGQQSVYVSPSGNDSHKGTFAAPLQTINKAYGYQSVDTIILLEGTYHEEVTFQNFSGTESKPKVIMAYPGHDVLMDGTIALAQSWEKHSGNIYSTVLNENIWQLFDEREMLMPARWPNAFLADGSVWDREKNWAHGNASAAENGKFVCAGDMHRLSDFNNSMKGAIAIMNIGSWKTYAREILSHEAGEDHFTYETVQGYKSKHHYYYLEGKPEFLDAPGEWYFNTENRQLLVWMPDNSIPSENLRAKNQSYAFSFVNCSHVQVKDIDFFATTFKFTGAGNVVVENCKLNYPSCSKRAIRDLSTPMVTSILGGTSSPTNNVLLNCEITNTESHALYMQGNSNRLENCYFHNIDWVVADRPKLMNSIYMIGVDHMIRRNTVHQCGASSTLAPGGTPIVELNRLWSTGHLQSDGSLTQLTIGEQPGSEVRYNWFHNTVKSGARFDAPIPPTRWGNGGAMHHNVIWETGSGLMLKGERHFCFNNSSFLTANNGIIVLDDLANGGGGNVGTLSHNNFSDKLSGHRKNAMELPGTASNNWNGYEKQVDFTSQVNDFENLDFRPVAGSDLVDEGMEYPVFADKYIGQAPDIGAYEYGDSVYWIAGRKMEKASVPIPGDGNETNGTNVDLMWLDAYKAVSHDVYFGENAAAVQMASQDSPEFKGSQTTNIFKPGRLDEAKSYYWRVDAKMPDGNVIKGDLWSFKANRTANVITGSVDAKSKEGFKVYPNPAYDFIFVKNASNTSTEYKLVCVKGSIVLQGKLERLLNRINISDVRKGIYTLVIRNSDKKYLMSII